MEYVQKRFLILALTVALMAILLFWNFSSPDLVSEELSSYFEERLTTLAIEDIGMPIEGFDAGILMQAYPALKPEDFNGVSTLEGKYEYDFVSKQLKWKRTKSQPISSAEKMIIDDGFKTLLSNVRERLNIEIDDQSSIDSLIVVLNTAERIETRIDQGGSALGVKVTPLLVLEDSRCSSDVTCVWAGTVRLRARLESGLGAAIQEFTFGQPITTEAEEVTLVLVEPEKKSQTSISLSEYRFYFEVKKRGAM